ncbi:hypothetical protein PIB30_005016 [Stylosanthes scabra]|uniref:F-box associated beta-propeller type 1 domain-containing protein n=1 Tax=Stylosanthes scabra TaxID=79078 RepID=A0ABU6Y395_9FABA|nr:hypothetical protein [Stylosanthes scabra]
MHPNKSNAPVPTLKSLTMSLRTLIHELREEKRLLLTREAFPDDFLWMIFVNAEPKLAARCKTLNKKWCSMLNSQLFITENYKANTTRQKDVIVGVGYSPADLKSQWFCKVDTQSNEGSNFEIPRDITPFGHYTMIGTDHGNICLRVSEAGVQSRLMVWNPLTHDFKWIHDDAWKYRDFCISTQAFGYLRDSLQYRIVHVFRRTFGQRSLSWSVYDSEFEVWSLEGTYNADIPKLGPQSIVSDQFYHAEIPIEAPTKNNALANFNGGVGFLTYRDVGFQREVVVWNMYREGHDELMWERMFTISDFAIPHTPSLLTGSSIIYVLNCGASSGAANNTERTDVYVCILKHMKGEMYLIYHNYWEDDVQVKSITLHSDGLYLVRKLPKDDV